MFEDNCDSCDLDRNTASKKKYTQFNDCSKYECLDERVQLSQKINPHCMTSFEVFSNMLIKSYHSLLYIFLSLLLLMIFATVNRKYRFFNRLCGVKKKQWLEETSSYDKNFVVFGFQGENLPGNQWFLEMDISKDFNSVLISRQDYLNLARVKVVNGRKSIWSASGRRNTGCFTSS